MSRKLTDNMKILLVANTDWYLYNFRRGLALSLRRQGHKVLLVSPAGPYSEKLTELGLEWRAVPISRSGLNPFQELKSILWLKKLIQEEEVEIVHGFTIKGAVYSSIAARLAGVSARVCSIDGLGYVFASSDLKARILRPIVQGLFKLALRGDGTRLILQNKDDVSLFVDRGISSAEHTRLILGAGVDCRRFTRGGERVEGQPLRVLLAARLLWKKGIGEYIEMARLLKSQGRNIEFLLAGSPDPGNPDSVPEEIVKSWVQEGLINWLGHVPDIASVLSTVHVVTLPSAYREGLPTSLTEAASCGLPLVTTDNPGCREVVTHEVDGLMVPVNDGKALAEAVARLADDPDLAGRLGEAARNKARTQFDEQIVIQKTEVIYSELANGHRYGPKEQGHAADA
jgi:glycosyltransferase involved in cell wall biosynthesis